MGFHAVGKIATVLCPKLWGMLREAMSTMGNSVVAQVKSMVLIIASDYQNH